MKVKSLKRKDASMAFYKEKEQLYIQAKTMGVNVITGLLQGRDRIGFPKDEAPDNMALW